MRVVSLNAWGGAMYDALSAWLPAVGADVLCLQEVTRTPGLSGWTHFEDAERTMPQRADLTGDLDSLLPHHRVWFTTSDIGPVSVDGQVHRQQFGTALCVADDLEVLAQRTAFVHGELSEHDAWPASGRPRAAQAVRVRSREGDRTLCVVGLHGLRDAAGKGDTEARRAQAERLADLVVATREPGDLVVVCGDLNLLPDSETFAVLAEVGLSDLVARRDTRTSRYPKPTRHASYLLVSDPGAVRAFDVPAAPEVSDHRPLVLDV